MGNIETKMRGLGTTLPGDYLKQRRTFLFRKLVILFICQGKNCRLNGKLIFEGKLGKDSNIDKEKQTALIKAEIGSLDKINKIEKILTF